MEVPIFTSSLPAKGDEALVQGYNQGVIGQQIISRLC
jgi:hypothetical protein